MGSRLAHDEAAAVMLKANLRPLVPYPGARRPWKCECLVCGHVGKPSYDNTRRRGSGCWECRNRKIGHALRGDADAAIAVMLAADFQPLEPYRNTDARWRCQCINCGEESTPRHGSVKNGSRCGICAGNRITPQHAEATMRAAQLAPSTPYPGKAITPWECRCTVCDHIVTPSYNSVQQGKGCGYCAGIRVDPEEAVAVMESVYIKPLDDYPGAHIPWQGTCRRCGEVVWPTYSSVKFGRGGCKHCGHDTTGAALRIDSEVAVQIMLDAGLEPLVEYPGVREPWLCRCVACRNEVTPRLDSIKNRNQGGCIFCASGGYDPTKPGAVYLMTHDAFGALKVGIRNLTSRRLLDHERNGWTLEDEWPFDDGRVAVCVEAGVLDWWRSDLGAPVACRPDQMPQGGYTETALVGDATAAGTTAYIERTATLGSAR